MAQYRNLLIIQVIAAFVGGLLFSALIAHAQSTITDIGGYQLNVPIPGVADQPTVETLAELVRFIYLWGMGVVALAAAIMVVYGGMQYFLSAGNPGRAQDARDQIEHALLGFIVVLGSYLILNTINPSLVNLGAAELPKIDRVVSKTFTGPPETSGGGQCVPKMELAGGSCESIGNGWITKPDACTDCLASAICCACAALDGQCESLWHTCVKKDPEGGLDEAPDDPVVCGPFYRNDCLNPQTDEKCPAGYPTCKEGDFCEGQPGGEVSRFQITQPTKPQGGNTITPVDSGSMVISVESPDTVNLVKIKIIDPVGAAVPIVGGDSCKPEGGACMIVWDPPNNPMNGTYVVEAQGLDDAGKAIAGMTDRVSICFNCGPTASFSVSAAISGGILQATACQGLANTFAPGPTGQAILLLDGSASKSLGGLEVNVYEWQTNGQPLGTNPFGSQVEAPLMVNTYTIKLVVTDNAGASGETTQSVLIVGSCL